MKCSEKKKLSGEESLGMGKEGGSAVDLGVQEGSDLLGGGGEVGDFGGLSGVFEGTVDEVACGDECLFFGCRGNGAIGEGVEEVGEFRGCPEGEGVGGECVAEGVIGGEPLGGWEVVEFF